MGKRGRVQSFAAPPCPVDPQHGPLYQIRPGYWYCGTQEHDGRPATHPQGAAPQVKKFFTDEELKENQK